MTRAEADVLIQEYDDAVSEYRIAIRMRASSSNRAEFMRMDACRERLIDALCGEERTEPLAGNAP